MAKIVMSEFEVELPPNWKDQGMITLTMPSTDPKVRPNIIVTVERLQNPTDLNSYFYKIKKSVQARGINGLKELSKKVVALSVLPAKIMICTWYLEGIPLKATSFSLNTLKLL